MLGISFGSMVSGGRLVTSSRRCRWSAKRRTTWVVPRPVAGQPMAADHVAQPSAPTLYELDDLLDTALVAAGELRRRLQQAQLTEAARSVSQAEVELHDARRAISRTE